MDTILKYFKPDEREVTLLTEFLEYCQASVSWYIPHRIKEGYSLQLDHIKMAVDQDIDLIITVDCGVTSHDAVGKKHLCYFARFYLIY